MSEPQSNETIETETPVEAPDSHEDEPKVFDADYVSKLRAEAAESRTAAKDAATRGDQLFEMLKLRTMEHAAGDIMQAISDMPADDPRYLDDNGFISADGIREVAQELVQAKPYLGKVRGQVHQGAKDTETAPSFGELLRASMR